MKAIRIIKKKARCCIAAVRRGLRVGDYVLCSRWSDEDPNDPWEIGFLIAIIEDKGKKKYLISKRFYPHCRRISAEEGAKIIETRANRA